MPVRWIRFQRLAALLVLCGLVVPPAAQAAPAASQPAGVPVVAAAPRAWPASLTPPGPDAIEIAADSFGLPLATDAAAAEYDQPSVLLATGDTLTFTVTLPAEGDYTIAFDMAAGGEFINAPEGQLLIDGALPPENPQHLVFPVFYENTGDVFPLDRYGNEGLIRQRRLVHWTTYAARDAAFNEKYPIHYHLAAGEHVFQFQLTQEAIYLGSVYIEPFAPPPSYADYLSGLSAPVSSGVLITLEAEQPSYKNDTSIRPVNSRSLEVTPYETNRLLLNTLGGDSWVLSGSAAYYVFDAPADGLYNLTLRALQDTRSNFTVFRRITVNETVVFDELNEVPFRSSNRWENVTLGGDTPYQIFLRQGRNVLGIEANTSPYAPAIDKIKMALVDINNLSLEIKKLTGNQVDQFKEWVILDYIPDIQARLTAIADDLEADKQGLAAINNVDGSQEVLSYQLAIDNLRFLAADPNAIPTNMTRLTEGAGSAAQQLAALLPLLQSQPLALDKIYIHSPDTPPPTESVSLTRLVVEGLKRFFYSFRPDPYQSIGASDDELEVWVNRPRQYVDLMQAMTDQGFTNDTGIRVKFSIMPDEAKLILANAGGIQPDVALGVSTNQPYELAIRNALKDLRTFPDFDSFIKIYSPGALLSYIINDSVYAIPETQDFWVTFYRKDILGSLDIPVPHTWNAVIEILPELQRFGLNYNTPLSDASATKLYLLTAPYIFNYGAKLYSDDGFSTGLGSEPAINAIKFMADSFTLYGMPLQTASFFESFRTGSIPVGVSNIVTYIKLLTAAPELNGLWGIDLYPATVLPDGVENRYATGSAQAAIMFANTDKPDEGWAFMKWWMSTETQVDFQQQLILNYGLTYLWNSANLETLPYLPIPPEHRQVIAEQWQWLQEPVKLPGSYMEERELSNAWNKIVFDGANPRVAIDTSVVIINREITRKMNEFGYLENGVKVREFKIPTIDTVRKWIADAE